MSFINNMDGIVLIDKQIGKSSYDVIKLVKRIYHTRKVGHCGTLDPFASGLLIIGINQATKIMSFLEHDYKEYEATVKLGTSTDTYDLTGKETNKKEIIAFTKEKLEETLNSFLGEIVQVPPIYSSIHIDGKHLYEYARNNETVEIPSRKVFIYEIKLISLKDDEFSFYVKCSRGTYIRTLGVDIANKLGNLGHLIYLRRLAVGTLNIKDANSFEDLQNEKLNVHDIKDILPFYKVKADDKQLIRIYNGQSISLNGMNYDKIIMLDGNKAVAIYELHEDGYYYCNRGLFNEEIRFQRLDELQRK